VAINTILPSLTTANVVEFTNLYFSNARVLANIRLANLNDFKDVVISNTIVLGQSLVWNGNAWINSSITANPIANTDFLVEGASNLYYTNARARAAFTAADPTIVVDWATGTIRANVIAIANAASSSDAVIEGNVNKYFTNARVYANIELAYLDTFRDVIYPLGNSAYIPNGLPLLWNANAQVWEPNVYTTGHAYSADIATEANTVLQINNFSTDDLREGSNNLYLTPWSLANLLANVSIDIFRDVNTQIGLATDKVLGWNGTTWIPRSVSDLANVTSAGSSDFSLRSGTANVALVANVANTVLTLNNFTTANVRESSSNLYFTLARVNAFVQPYLTTANVRESPTNLYFTNARVNAFVQPFLTTANVSESSSNLYFTVNRVVSTVNPILTTANVAELYNEYFTNTRAIMALATDNVTVGKNLTVSDDLIVLGGNVRLAASNVQIAARTITLASGATTKTQAQGAGILIDGANAKLTYSEPGDAVTLNKQFIISGNILPAVSGIYNIGSPEKKFQSLYLGTQTIFLGNISLGESPKGGLDVKTPSGDPSDGNFANLTATESITINRIYSNVFPLTELNAYIGGNVIQWGSNTTGNLYFGIKKDDDFNKFSGIRIVRSRTGEVTARSDVIIYNESEGVNLSKARIAVLGDGNTNITGDVYLSADNKFYGNIKGDLLGNVTGVVSSIHNHSTANLVEHNNNLYYTNSRVVSAVIPLLTTSNVVEGTNLYFTNARARAAITGGTGVGVDWNTGTVSIGQNVNTTSSVTFRNVSVTDNLIVYGGVETFGANNLVVSDNMIYLNSGSINSNPDIGISFNYNDGQYRHGGFFRDATDGVFKVFENYLPEPDANIFIDTDHASFRIANIQATTFIGNVLGTVSSLNNHNTDDLAEGTNKYYLDSRAIAAVSPFLTTANVTEVTNKYYTDTRVVNAVTPLLTTANVVEMNGQFHYSNSRSLGYIQTLSINELSDVDTVIRTPIAGHALMYDGTKWVANVVSALASPASENANVANTVISLEGHTTSEIAEGSNLYFTGARAVTAVTPLLTTANTVELTNLYYTNSRVVSAVTPLLTTANVIETPGNLYYSNSRALGYIQTLSINELFDVDTVVRSPIAGHALIYDGTKWVANVIVIPTTAFANNSATANIVVSLSNHNTDDLAEGANLYYTNARVLIGITTGTVQGNVVVSDTVTANNFVTGTGAGGTITGASLITTANLVTTAITASSWFNLYTSNVIENGGLLYYTNSRVVSAVTPLLTTANTVELTNLYYTNSRVVSAVTPLLTTANTVELTNLYFTGARAVSAVTPLLTTSNVVEGTNLYFTPARVFANVEQMSINVFADVNTTGLQPSGILVWNGTQFVAGTVSASTTSNTALFSYLAEVANTVVTLNNHTTANLAEGVNLYYTNSRVVSAIIPLLTTSNVVEGTNLYFTNARVAPALLNQDVSLRDLTVIGNLVVQGDVTTLNTATLEVEDKNITVASGAVSGAQADGAGITVAGAEATIAYRVVGDKFVTNKNFEVDGTLRANSWSGLYTSNVVENTNLYYTNSRVVSAITPLLTTSNVVEGTNLYFTTARVLANVSQMSVNVFADVDLTGVAPDSVLLWDGTKFTPSLLANKLTTANVIELGNLYFTNARAVAAIQNADAIFGNVRTVGTLTVSSGLGAESTSGIEFFNNPAGGTGDSAKIQYYAANYGVTDGTVFELSVTNNADDSINFKTAGGGLGYNVARPTQDVDFDGNTLIRRNLTVSNKLFGSTGNFTGKLEANGLTVNGTQIVDGDSGVTNIVVSRITSNVWNGLYTANVIESPTNLYFTNARVAPALINQDVSLHDLTVTGNLTVYGDLTTLNTASLTVEDKNITIASGATNGAQADGAGITVAGADASLTYYVVGDKFSFNKNLDVNGTIQANSWAGLYTSNVIENAGILYFTNARVITAVTPLLTTANVIESAGNLYYTNARVDSYVSTLSVNVFADVNTTGIGVDGILLWNGTQFVSGVLPSTNTANIALFSYLAEVANTVVSLSNHTTANLVEGTNLYFSNARARAALAGQDLAVNNLVANTLVINNALTSAVTVTDVQTPNPYLITQFNITRYRTAEYIYTAKGKAGYAGLYNSGKILLLHDDTNVYFTQYGILLTGDGTELVTFSADINNSNVRLFAQVTDPAIICDIRLSGTTYTEA
jgi:hypothetical protein